MKCLLLYPETPDAFWSFKESCRLTGYRALLPPLGLLTVAAILPDTWEYRLVDMGARKLAPEDWHWADLVMISGMLIHKPGILALIRAAKERGKTVVVGGPCATALPREILAAGADFLVCGEGENTLPRLVEALGRGEQSGVFQEEDKPDITLSPVPRYDLVNLADYSIVSLQTSRGCPYDCEFCDVVNLFGRQPRYKTPGQVIAEMETLYRLGWRGLVFISDDNFIGHRDHARAILGHLTPWLQSRGEPFGFWTQASVNLGQDLEMIDLLTAANFGTIFFGVETPDEDLLKLNRKYQNLRSPAAQSLGNITRNGLTPMASFIIGFDREKPGAGDRICEFVEENHIPLVMLNLLHVLPNTSLWQRLAAEGRLREIPMLPEDITLLYDLNYIPDRPEAEILQEFARAVDRLFEPSRYLARNYRHILAMRPTRRATRIKEHQEAGPPRAQARLPWRRQVNNLKTLLRIIWRQGLASDCRRQFWWQLWGVYRRNPSRLIRYLSNLSSGETMFAIRREVRRLAAAKGIKLALAFACLAVSLSHPAIFC